MVPEGEARDDEQEEGEQDQPTTSVKLMLRRERVERFHRRSLRITGEAPIRLDRLEQTTAAPASTLTR